MKTKRFDFNWKPLQLQISFAVDGSVPDQQNYNADSSEFTPDYTITPLIIQPNVSILDKDEVLAAGSINHKLTNVRWYENFGGTRQLIDTTTNNNYEITTAGATAGRIKVKRNAQPKQPITLEFYAEYIDTRTNQVMVIQGSYLIPCSSSSDTVRVELNAADQTVFNPLSDPVSQTVTATVRLGESICPANRYQLVWEILGEDDTWHAVGTDETLDYHITVSGNTATINRWLMGNECYLRCRCKYSADGTPGSVTLTAASPQAMVAFIRRLPAYEFDIAETPYNVPAGILRIAPKAVVRTTVGVVADPEKEILPLWYMATNKASGSLSYALIGHGINPTVPTALMSQLYGGVLGLDCKDRGAAGAWMDNSDGKVLCDGDGKVVIIH